MNSAQYTFGISTGSSLLVVGNYFRLQFSAVMRRCASELLGRCRLGQPMGQLPMN